MFKQTIASLLESRSNGGNGHSAEKKPENASTIYKVFIVEEDEFLGNILKRTLEKISDAQVHLFKTPQECLNNLHLNPDVVSIDYYLPGMNGLEMMEKIRNYNNTINCIIVSGQEKVDIVLE